jgi:tripartite-type tricarboxylate transporter receptor subunit TctC
MTMCRRIAATVLGIAWFASAPGNAMDYPGRAVHVVVPTAPGGGNDLVARMLAAFLQNRLGQPFVVDNKPGAQNLVGTKYVALAPSDGYTLLVSASISSFPVFNKNPGFEVAKDLAFISPIMRAPQVLAVNAARPYRTVADLSAISRADPGKLNFTSYGLLLWLQTEMFNRAAGIKATHVAFSNAPEAAKAVASGDADFLLASLATLRSFLNRGELRPLTITANERDPEIPDVPSLREAGVKMDNLTVWIGVFAPKDTPPPIVDKLNSEVRAFVADPTSSNKLKAVGFTPVASSPEEFKLAFQSEEARMIEVGKELGIKPE